jgi:hypothetical protein
MTHAARTTISSSCASSVAEPILRHCVASFVTPSLIAGDEGGGYCAQGTKATNASKLVGPLFFGALESQKLCTLRFPRNHGQRLWPNL